MGVIECTYVNMTKDLNVIQKLDGIAEKDEKHRESTAEALITPRNEQDNKNPATFFFCTQRLFLAVYFYQFLSKGFSTNFQISRQDFNRKKNCSEKA